VATRGARGRLIRPALTCVAFSVLWFFATQALADQFLPKGNGWQTYVNERYGMRFDYPVSVFSAEAPPENGDGQSFTGDGTSLQIFAFHNLDQQTPAALKQQLLGKEGYDDVTYSPTGKTWLVLSGYRGKRIFYEKYFFNDDVVAAFGIEFPADQKPHYAPIIERIEDSFRAGHSD
jgi:hypothetical protein